MPPRNYLIQYLTRAITLEWDGPIFVKFTIRQLTQEEIDDIALEQQMILQDFKNKFMNGFADKAKSLKIEGEIDINKL